MGALNKKNYFRNLTFTHFGFHPPYIWFLHGSLDFLRQARISTPLLSQNLGQIANNKIANGQME